MNIRPFEIGLIAFFVIAGIVGIVALKGFQDESSDGGDLYGKEVIVWGTFDQSKVSQVFAKITETDPAFGVVKYHSFDEETLQGDLVNAIADGESPDLVLLPHTMLVSLRSKLAVFPEETFNERTLRSTYIDGAGIFGLSDGIYGVPLGVDPMVLFWNRDLYAGAGLAEPPKTWEGLVNTAVPRLTEYGDGRKVVQSAVGLGEYINVNHAREILVMLFLQAGTNLVEEKSDSYVITLLSRERNGEQPVQAALRFYTQFSSPISTAYTWNRTQQFDRNAFTAGKLAMYFGFGSEINDVEAENPNLSFDVATVPQAQGATALRNYGTFYAFTIPKASQNARGAELVAKTLSGGPFASELLKALELAPAERSLYSAIPGDVYDEILRESALITRGWLDPSPRESDSLFKTMVDEVTSGRKEITDVVDDAVYSLEALFR